jgi:transcription antitermination factor NusG
MPWYAIQTKPNKERSVQAALDEAGIEVYCPRVRSQLRRADKKSWKEAALFPGYLFARFDFTRDYPRLRWKPGLVRVVTSGVSPLAVTDTTLASVRQMEKEGIRGLLRPIRWKPGTRVRVVQGPFAGFEGRVSLTLRGGDRIRILLELFRRQAALECEPGLLEPLVSAGGL